MAYTCKTCGAVAEEPGHLCAPLTETTACPYCGKVAPTLNITAKARPLPIPPVRGYPG